jgi:hypothetical protein
MNFPNVDQLLWHSACTKFSLNWQSCAHYPDKCFGLRNVSQLIVCVFWDKGICTLCFVFQRVCVEVSDLLLIVNICPVDTESNAPNQNTYVSVTWHMLCKPPPKSSEIPSLQQPLHGKHQLSLRSSTFDHIWSRPAIFLLNTWRQE